MKLFEGGTPVSIAKLWPFIKAMNPWLRNNWKYFAVSLFAWLILFAMYFSKETKNVEDDNAEVREQRDVASSLASMEPMVKIEQKLVQALNEYANQLQRKVDSIRRGIATMRKTQFIHKINEEEFLGNPFNSFPMLRRLKHEWKAWEKYLKAPEKTEYIDIIHKTLVDLKDFDLVDSVLGVQRLREMYDIQPNDWTDGKLHFGEFDVRFTSLDCYAVAFLLHKQEEYEAADEWFEAALNSFGPKGIYKYLGYNISIIYETYVDNLLKQNNTEMALMITNAGLKRDFSDLKLIERKLFIENLNNSLIAMKPAKVKKEIESSIKRGCRGQYAYNGTLQLFCYYNSTTNDFVRLAPFKVEEILRDPIILIYHDLLSDNEISNIKSIAKSNLKRSLVWNNRLSKGHVSKNVWLKDDLNDLTKQLNRRFEDMTGLNSIGSNILVGNYGLGGHYVEHRDCQLERPEWSTDDRIITVLVYLTNVESGGSTIFPKLQVGASPQKAKALVWYNLKNNFDCDSRTVHMACPVLFGSKWFLVKWIYYQNQVFRKPCFEGNPTEVS